MAPTMAPTSSKTTSRQHPYKKAKKPKEPSPFQHPTSLTISQLEAKYAHTMERLRLRSIFALKALSNRLLKLSSPQASIFKPLEDRTRIWKNDAFDLVRTAKERALFLGNSAEQFCNKHPNAPDWSDHLQDILDLKDIFLRAFYEWALGSFGEYEELVGMFDEVRGQHGQGVGVMTRKDSGFEEDVCKWDWEREFNEDDDREWFVAFQKGDLCWIAEEGERGCEALQAPVSAKRSDDNEAQSDVQGEQGREALQAHVSATISNEDEAQIDVEMPEEDGEESEEE